MEGRLSERAGETGAARDDAESGGGVTDAGGSPALDAMLRQVRGEVPAVLRACGAPWATMAVRLAGRTATWVWNAQDSGGDADVAARVTDATVVRWGSMAKPVTALAVLRLAALGRIGLDDSAVARSASFYPSEEQLGGHRAEAITIRQLLTHTSGIGVPRFRGIGWDRRRPRASAVLAGLDGARAWRLEHAPGAGQTYGSAAYVWLQSIVEDVCGEAFESCVRTLLFGPLGLDRVWLLGDGEVRGEIAWGVEADGTPISARRSPVPGATGLFAGPRDVVRLLAGLVDADTPSGGAVGDGGSASLRDLFSPEWLGQVLMNQTPGFPEAWGLGWRLQDSQDGLVFRHAGWPDGVLAYTEGLPRLGLLTCFEIGCAGAKRALVRLADIARWHGRMLKKGGAGGGAGCS
ncbi:MAG: beta-lactamase family protein [Phycisphaeraceae bacterium]|nr:beta-lactamase family protein [Phycisphaeraceae bacterium]